MDEEFELKRDGSEAFLVETWHATKGQQINAVFQWESPEEVPLRIGIVGAHGTGKTQLARKIAKELDLILIEEVARCCYERGYSLNKNTNINAQTAIWLGQLYEQYKVNQFVSDGTILGHLSYLELLNERQDLGADRALFNCLKNFTHIAMDQQYTIVFYLPVEKPPVTDSIRSIDKRFQKKIDEIIFKNLTDFDTDYFPLPGSINQKFKAAMSYLEDSGLTENNIWNEDTED